MSGTDLPTQEISDEMARAFNRAFNEAYDRLGDEEPYGAVRAGLAAALVASGYRREAEVLREAAKAYAKRWRSAAGVGWSVALPSAQADVVSWLNLRAAARKHGGPATALKQSLPLLADGLEGQERSEEKRCPNCAPGYDCERGIYEPVSSTGEEKTDGR